MSIPTEQVTLDEVIASAIRGYVAGELCGYSYHGDGSAIEALKRIDKDADGIAAYARTHAGFTGALIAALQLTEEHRELADGMGGISTDLKTGETTTHSRPCTRQVRLVGPWVRVERSSE